MIGLNQQMSWRIQERYLSKDIKFSVESPENYGKYLGEMKPINYLKIVWLEKSSCW